MHAVNMHKSVSLQNPQGLMQIQPWEGSYFQGRDMETKPRDNHLNTLANTSSRRELHSPVKELAWARLQQNVLGLGSSRH